MSESNENRYKTIYTDIMPVYRESEDYCRMAIGKLRETIARGDRAQIADAYGELTKYFNDLTETVNVISERFKQVSELLDEQLNDGKDTK